MEIVFDVILVGYGPVGQALALMLGRQGRSVAAFERWAQRYPLPRAVCIDHEIYRVLEANGMGAVLPSVSQPAPKYQWFNAEWEELLVIDFSAESISGGTEVNFVHQPTLEDALSEAVERQPGVKLFAGCQAIAVEQDASLCRVTVRDEAGKIETYKARYVVGCDGANSIVRGAISEDQEDRGFEADWLVVDVRLRDGVTIETLGIPPAGQYCNPVRPTTIAPAGVRGNDTFRRWEFMRLPGETVEELEREERIWELLKPWAGPADVELVRHKVYNFRSLLAKHWRDRRFLLAGDAAHVMPPFLGQGMCSGIRDAWNLAWKLGLTLDGKADDRLLDTYQPERMPHVSQIIDISIYLGQVICMPDPEEAAARDRAFKSGQAPPPPPFPHLTDGLLRRDSGGTVQAGAGMLSPHVMVERRGTHGRFDDLVGLGFVLVTSNRDLLSEMEAEVRETLGMIGTQFASLHEERGEFHIVDMDGRLGRFMALHGWDTFVVRPDFYVYGGSLGRTEGRALLRGLVGDLECVGVSKAPSAVGLTS